ncbi:MAG: glycoside-pentoside-hexuronide (GPH):cation symporter [Clostridia bacterium]|nr:glycoside-pentoside-hexuronide (GPH):cation symporter [Clostridia bacterium]
MSKKTKVLSAEDKQFRRNKWCYSIPGTGRDLAYNLYNSFLLTYIMFTRQLTGQQFSAISVIMIVCCIWDGINDPIMGGIIENTRTKFGKFKPWIFVGAISNAVILALIFSNRTQGWTFVALFAVFYLLWDLTFTMNDISYWSMLSSLTSKAQQRDSITSMANLFAGLGTVISFALVPILTAGDKAIGGSSVTAYAVIAITFAVLFAAGQVTVCATVKEPYVANVPLEDRIGIKKLVKVIFSNDQLLWVAVIMFLVNVGGAIVGAFGTNYFYLEFGYDGSKVTMFTAFYAGASGIVYLVYPKLSKIIGRYKMAFISLVMTVGGYIALFITGFVLKGQTKLWFYCAEGMIVGFAFSLFYMVITICLMNTIEYNEYKTGNRNEGIIFAVRPFMAKMSSAFQKLLTMIVYLAIGMLNITNGISDLEQRANAKEITEQAKLDGISDILSNASPYMAIALRCVIVVLPITLIAVGYIVMKKKMKIDEAEYERMMKEIEARKVK